MSTAPTRRPVTEPSDFTTEANRAELTPVVLRLFERWQLDTAQQLNLLGLSATSRSMLSKYRAGGALPGTRDCLDRIGWLLAIHKALRLLYPYNETLRYGWIKHRNTTFGERTPLEVMAEDGIIGLARVARYLDWQRGR